MEDQGKLNFRQTLSALLRSNRRHARYIQALVCLALIVAVAVPLSMRQSGVAMSTTETRLSCHYSGSGAHTHNADCYDDEGNLVCPLEEKAFHTHTDECYATERVLVCGQEETAGHTHSASCYDAEGNLTCTLTEEPAHKHTDACYEERITDELVCGLEETAEEHVHGPACFETVTVQVADAEGADEDSPVNTTATVEGALEEDPTPAQEFTGTLKQKDENGNEYVTLVAQVKAPQGVLPKGSTMRVEAVDLQARDAQDVPDGPTVQDKLNEALRTEAGDTAAFTQTDAVDITFYDEQGNRINPANKVEVRITTSMIRTFSDQRTANDEAVANNSLLVLHVVDKQHTTRTDAPDAEVMRDVYLINQDEHDTTTGHEDTIVFEATEFSAYVVARVDNAHVAPEAEPVVADPAELAEAEAKAADEAAAEADAAADKAEAADDADPAEAKDAAKATDPTHPAQTFTHRFTGKGGKELLRVDVAAPEGAFPAGTTMKVKWVDTVEVEDAVGEAVAERTDGKLLGLCAVDITFYDPEGNEIEPAKKITVTFGSDFIDTEDDSYVVHIDDKGKGEVVDALGAKDLEKREIADQADELVFESDAFSTYVVAVTALRKELTAGDGKTYDISVDAPAEAGIPQDAELRVSEIVEGDEGYEEYLAQAVETAGLSSADEASYARFFDIEIWSGKEKIEPSGDVQVSIKLMDTTDEEANLRVVHFSADGPEMMELLSEEATDQSTAELTFATSEFSVYSVVNVTSAADLAGKSYVLVSGIAGDPGATTGYGGNSWGTDYATIIVNAHAVGNTQLKDDQGRNDSLSTIGVHTWQENGVSYAGGSAPEWTFESAENGRYYLRVTGQDGITRYLQRYNKNNNPNDFIYGWEARLVSNQSQASQFSIDVNNDGTVLIRHTVNYDYSNHNYYLHNNGSGEFSARNYKFGENGNTSSAEYRFRLCQKSDDFDPFAAQKVAAKDITTNVNYIIYRKFVDDHDNEALYALAHDGTFVRVYDGGDMVYYRETNKNILWNYQMENSSPVLFTRDPVTNEPIYINPNHSTGQTLSTTAGGLTLLGKDNGEYGTSIERWDQTAYDYAGLHVTQNNSGASLSTGTRVAGTSDEFLFAKASEMPAGTEETVATVDSDSLGIKITMFDYGDKDTEYTAGTKLSEMTDIAGSDEYTPHEAHALVKPYLESGVPSSRTAGAMTGLFSSGGAIKYSKTGVNRLFLQSYYDESGTFRYRSEDNYAYLGFDETDFTVYRQAATPYTTDQQPGHTYYYHGHFMPFNDIDMNNNLSRLMNQYGNAYENGNIVGELPIEDGRTYEDIYGVQGIPNFYTGMKMEANFMQPKDGKLENGDDMVFKFTGDDDMWVYIDGVLVLDIGGIHEPLSGTIDFATGKVTNPTGSSLAGETTLKAIFMNVLNDSNTPESVKEKIRSIAWDGDTFADYSSHSFSAFYMERGAGASNLDIQFNLKVVRTNQFTVEKKIPEGVDDRFDNHEYKFQATYKDANGYEHPLHAGITNVCTAVVYRDRVDDQGNPVNVHVDENGYFTLRAGEAAIFRMGDDAIQYDVKEVEIDSNIIDEVEINGQVVNVEEGVADADYAFVGSRPQVITTNHPYTQSLLITKHITGRTTSDNPDNAVFEFRIYLETTSDDGTRHLTPYAYGPYYLVKEEGGAKHYFTLTGENNAPEDKGTEPIVCSIAGRSGSINSIPPEYTIEIPNLVVGTNFYLEERRDNIPYGYSFDREELREGTYDPQDLDESAEDIAIHRIIARDETDHQEFDPHTVGRIKKGIDAESHVYNKPFGITVEKKWEGDVTSGTATMVLYQSKVKPSNTFDVTIIADPAPVTTGVGYIDVSYSGTKADGTEDSGTFKLNNENGWSKAFTFAKGSSYTFTYAADGSKVLSATPDKTGAFSKDTTVTLNTEVAPITQYTYTFTVPASQSSGLPTGGSIEVTCNGATKTANSNNNWTVDFQVAEETPVSYSMTPDGTYIASVTPPSGSDETASSNKTIEMTPVATRVYTFTVPEGQRPSNGKGSITVTCNGATKTVSAENGWTVAFRLAEGTAVSYDATADNKFIDSVALNPESTGAAVSSDQTITLTPTLATTTMTVPVTITWSEEPVTGTEVTFTLTPSSGGYARTVTMSQTGTTWTYNVENLERIDDDGNLITWTVGDPTVTPPDPNVSVKRTSGATISGSGAITMQGTVASSMNLTFTKEPNYTVSGAIECHIYNASATEDWQKVGDQQFSDQSFGTASNTTFTESNLSVIDDGDEPIYYFFYMRDLYMVGSGTPYKMKITTNATNAYIDKIYGNDVLVFKAQAGDVLFNIEHSSSSEIITGSNSALASQSLNTATMSAPMRTMAKAFANLRLMAARPSSQTTFYDDEISGATGDTVFTLVEAKELPADATPVTGLTDGHGNPVNGTQVITNDDTFTWSNLPTTDSQGNPLYYYVVEKDAAAVAENMSVKYVYEYHENNPAKGISKVKIINTTEGIPEPEKGNVQVTKIFSGIDALPSGFQIAYSYVEYEGEDPTTGTFTVANATGAGTVASPYTWTLNDLPEGTEVTFTESGMSVDGYNLTAKVNGTTTTAAAPTATTTVVANETVTTQFVNEYAIKPGDLELTKKVAGTGADTTKEFAFTIALTAPAGVTLADAYQATLNGAAADPVAFTEGAATIQVNLKASDVYLIDDLPAGTTYTITETDYAADGYTAAVTEGALTGTVAGGTTTKTAVEITNTYSAVEINIIKIDETTRSAATQTKLSGATFELYKWTPVEGGGSGNYTAYPDAASCSQTSGADGKLSFGKLPNGKYKIIETHAPDGYVAYNTLELYFTISADSTLTWTNSAGETITEQSLVEYSSTDKAFIVGNTPGAELPEAGGPGTILYTLCGIAMIAAAGYIGFVSRRKAREEVA